MNQLKLKLFNISDQGLNNLSKKKVLISTLNAHSFNVAQQDLQFQEALLNSDILIPDGISIVWAKRWLSGDRIKKIAGADLFFFEMERVNAVGGKCFFLGSSFDTLEKIQERAKREYSKLDVFTYSPPYKAEFTADDNELMIAQINVVKPEVLFIGMTAPKQEKWAYQHFEKLQVGHVCCIGAVFDFYAGTVSRAPQWMIKIGLEWFYRLLKEPKRMWRRYLIGNIKFLYYILIEKFSKK